MFKVSRNTKRFL